MTRCTRSISRSTAEAVATAIEPHRNLVEFLARFDLFGARESCGQGLCGCCTVLVDGVAVSGCLYFAIWVDGKSVTTVEHSMPTVRSPPCSRPLSIAARSNAAFARRVSC